MKYVCGLVLAIAYFSTSISIAQESSKTISDSVSSVCQKPNDAGSYWDVKVKGDGSASVKLILAKLGITGDAEFSQGEWDGIRASIEDSADYRDCVKYSLPFFIEKFTPILEYPTEQKSNKRTLGGLKWQAFNGGVELVLESCGLNADTVSCSFTAEAVDKDLEIEIEGKSSVYDQLGNKILIGYVSVANFRGEISAERFDVDAELIRGVKTPIVARFVNATEGAKSISKAYIEMSIKGSSSSRTGFDFRDVAIDLIK